MISSFKRGSSFPVIVLIGLLSTAAFFVTRSTAEEARNVPAPSIDEQAFGKTSETAVIAGGCFWGVQGVFQHVSGVTNAVRTRDDAVAPRRKHHVLRAAPDVEAATSVRSAPPKPARNVFGRQVR